MKKLKKLSINPEKVINNDELLNLKAGYYGPYLNGYWACECDGVEYHFYASTCESAQSAAEDYLLCIGKTIVCCD